MDEQLETIESIEVKKCLFGIQTLSTLVMLLEAKVDEKVSRDDFEKLIEASNLMSEHIERLQNELDELSINSFDFKNEVLEKL